MAARSSSSPPTPGQQWRDRRNLVIAAAHLRLGLSQRFLADVFDLRTSAISAIVQKVAADAEAVERKLDAERPRSAFPFPVVHRPRPRKSGQRAGKRMG